MQEILQLSNDISHPDGKVLFSQQLRRNTVLSYYLFGKPPACQPGRYQTQIHHHIQNEMMELMLQNKMSATIDDVLQAETAVLQKYTTQPALMKMAELRYMLDETNGEFTAEPNHFNPDNIGKRDADPATLLGNGSLVARSLFQQRYKAILN